MYKNLTNAIGEVVFLIPNPPFEKGFVAVFSTHYDRLFSVVLLERVRCVVIT